jgi:hypothetical protein
MSQKKENTQMSEVFTIDLDLHSDSHEIPGVTSLLNPAKMLEAEKLKAATKEAALPKNFTLEATRTVATSTNAAPPPILQKSPQRLKDLSVLFDLQFTVQNGSFRFHTSTPHSEPFLQAWQQELLTNMKLDLKAILFKDPFQEFRFETFGYLYAAFGVQPTHFIQVVQAPQSPECVHVLVSSQSQANQKDAILSILQQSPAQKAAVANDASGIIEIDLAG